MVSFRRVVTVDDLPTAGETVVDLYLDDGSGWVLKDSDSDSGKLIASYPGDYFSTTEDDRAVVVYPVPRPASSCSTTYTLTIES